MRSDRRLPPHPQTVQPTNDMAAMEAKFARLTTNLVARGDRGGITSSITAIDAKLPVTDKRVDGLEGEMKNMKEDMGRMKSEAATRGPAASFCACLRGLFQTVPDSCGRLIAVTNRWT